MDLQWFGSTVVGLGSSNPDQSAFGLPPVHVTQESLDASDMFPNLGFSGANDVLGGGDPAPPGVLGGSASSPAILVGSTSF